MIWYLYILQNDHYQVSLTSITTHSYNFFVWWALLTPTFLETSKCTSIINYRHHVIHYYFITGSVYFFTTFTDFTRIFNGGKQYLVKCYLSAHTMSLFISVQFCSVAQSCPTLWPHESHHARPPCPSPTPGVHSDSRLSSESVMPSSHLFLSP